MKKNISLLLAAMLLGGIFPLTTSGFTNPLKSYDLYADTHHESSPTDNVMSEVYYQKSTTSTNRTTSNKPPEAVPTTAEGGVDVNADMPTRRNDYLRESSRKTYSSGEANWTKGPYFYDKPNLQSIIKKYHLSNFAGCMQECEAYVKKNPRDTLGYYYLAMSYAKCGKKEDAISAYEKVISIHDNPMIVKYATNGRNCVMNNESEARCFQNVNEPELLYPYRDMAKNTGLTPVNPQDLIDRNYAQLSEKFGAVNQSEEATQDGNNGEDKSKKIQLPFSNQDDSLDKFINAPYGDGFSPELQQQYKQQQLKNIQENINKEDKNNPGKYFENLRNIKDFDSNKKSQGEETIKLALADNMDVADIFNDPEYIRNKKELDEIKMMFGDYGDADKSSDITSMLPQLAKEGENVSPEVVQMMMMQTVMPNIIDTDSKSGF